MSEETKADDAPDAEVEIRLTREDMLMLSDGRSFDYSEVVEASDGTVMDLTVTLTGAS